MSFGDAEYAHEEVDGLPPTDPPKIVCVGRNYADTEENDRTLPEQDRHFLETPNTPGSHDETITSDRRRDVESDHERRADEGMVNDFAVARACDPREGDQ